MDVNEFKRRIWYADNRNAGEKYAEGIVSGLFNMPKVNGAGYDLRRRAERCEVKSTRIVSERCESNEHLSLLERAFDFACYEQHTFGGNLQHIKLQEFDHLSYVAFFRDAVVIFEMTTEVLRKHATLIGYSSTQARYSKQDCDGQFALRTTNLHIHLRQFFKARLSYEEALHNFLLASDVSNTIQKQGISDRSLTLSNELFACILANPGLVVADLAMKTGLTQKLIHEVLALPEGQSLVRQGLVAAERGKPWPTWAIDMNGEQRDVPIAERMLQPPQQQLLVIPQPPSSGSPAFDDMNAQAHTIDTNLINARKIKDRLTLIRDKEMIERDKANAVGRINEKVDAMIDTNEALRDALASKADALASKDKMIALLEEEIARLRTQIEPSQSRFRQAA